MWRRNRHGRAIGPWLRAHFEFIASARQKLAEARLHEGFALPSVGEDFWRIRLKHLWVFDACDTPRRDGEHLGDADEVLEDRNTLRRVVARIDGFARRRTSSAWTFGTQWS